MKLNVTIPIEQYNQLKEQSEMLRRIAGIVVRYARTPTTTTYECVVKLDERERKMSAKIQAHKNLGGKFLGSNETNEPMNKCPKCKKSDEVVTRPDGTKYCLDCGETIALGPSDATPCSSSSEFRYLGDFAACEIWAARHMTCDTCRVSWTGCWDNFMCPECGEGDLPSREPAGMTLRQMFEDAKSSTNADVEPPSERKAND